MTEIESYWLTPTRIGAIFRHHYFTNKIAQGESEASLTRRLTGERLVEGYPPKESGIAEIDALEQAFVHMATQISAYRTELRRYLGAFTKSQEDERRRIAHKLHDDTIQSLLAIQRRIELFRSSESDPQHNEQLEELQEMLTQTLAGIRQINRDLRPLILDDLGLIPALKALVRAAQTGENVVPPAKLEPMDRQFPYPRSKSLLCTQLPRGH